MSEPKKRRLDTEIAVSEEDPHSRGAEKEGFWDAFKNLYGSDTDSDVTLYLGADKIPFPGHSFILNIRSGVFRSMMKKKKDGKYELEIGRGIFIGPLKLMLQYIYTGDYDLELCQTAPEEFKNTGFLNVHAYIYADAYRFSVKDLKELCVEKFEKEALISWKNDSFYHFTKFSFLFGDVDYYISEKDTESDWCIIGNGRFRKVILEIVMEHLQELREDTRFKKLVTDSEEFSCALLRRILEH